MEIISVKVTDESQLRFIKDQCSKFEVSFREAPCEKGLPDFPGLVETAAFLTIVYISVELGKDVKGLMETLKSKGIVPVEPKDILEDG